MTLSDEKIAEMLAQIPRYADGTPRVGWTAKIAGPLADALLTELSSSREQIQNLTQSTEAGGSRGSMHDGIDAATKVQEAYDILCAGKPPHSARESNARRALRVALNRDASDLAGSLQAARSVDWQARALAAEAQLARQGEALRAAASAMEAEAVVLRAAKYAPSVADALERKAAIARSTLAENSHGE